MVAEPAKTFTRKFLGYEQIAVDAHIESMTTKQQLLRDDIENLRSRLRESGEQVAALRSEVTMLTDTSPSPHAMQKRMAKMLRQTVDEVSEMQDEARAEAEALIAAAVAEAEAERRKHEDVVTDLIGRQRSMEAEYEETKERLEAELADMRAETQSAIDDSWRNAQRERQQLLAEARDAADQDREHARRMVDEASHRRIRILEQLMGVHRDLDPVQATLEAAYEEHKIPLDADAGQSSQQKVSAG